MRRALLGLAALLLLIVAGCSSDASDGGLTATVVPDRPFTIGDQALTDTDGNPVDLAADPLDKRLTLVFFGYTRCPDICPATLQTIASGLTRLSEEDRDQVGLVFVTTDPTTDTPAVLSRYLEHFDPEFLGATADLDTVVALGRTVGIYVSEGEAGQALTKDQLGAHGTQVLALESNGEVPAYWDQETSSAEYAADIEQMLGED